jgi:hypothetical protein
MVQKEGGAMKHVDDLFMLTDLELDLISEDDHAADVLRSKARSELIKREESRTSLCFDYRNEVSADARYTAKCIVKHMWIIFVLLPAMLYVLAYVLK